MITVKRRQFLLATNITSPELEKDLEELISMGGLPTALLYYSEEQIREILTYALQKRIMKSKFYDRIPGDTVQLAIKEGIEEAIQKFVPSFEQSSLSASSASIISYAFNWVEKALRNELYTNIDCEKLKIHSETGEVINMMQYSRLPKWKKSEYTDHYMVKESSEETIEVYEYNGNTKIARRKRK